MRSTDGVLLIDKPAGLTSHDVVAVARRALGERRVGHTGTLDPFATGLLVLLCGRATRLLPYVEGEPKEYEALIAFGAETDTDDVTGTVTRTAPPPSRAGIEVALARLTGRIQQEPPAYSAKQVDGRRAYRAARRGTPLALPRAAVTVHEWRLHHVPHDGSAETLTATIVCSGGTYVRALARDLGRLANSAAHLAALRRARSGTFHVRDAQPLEEITAGQARVLPPLAALPSLPVQPLDAEASGRVARGMRVDATRSGERAALVDAGGHLLAIGERIGESWQPRVVMRDG
ncbi:MAG TPA: tRNA pseudouridine(55) synthase TruB [Gemmatimonadaceae bacterium]|nr:tRNA pseudouridine(55) synthase TruB [Gemmatimonadaceae bacterium]